MFWPMPSTTDFTDKTGIILLSIKEQDTGEREREDSRAVQSFMESKSWRVNDLVLPDVEPPSSDLVGSWKVT